MAMNLSQVSRGWQLPEGYGKYTKGPGTKVVGYYNGVPIYGPIPQPSLAQRAQTLQEETKAANEKRLQDILALYENVGVQGAADIEERGRGRLGSIQQEMISAGLSGSSAGWAPSALAERETMAEKRRLAEEVAQLKGGTLERVSETGPDLSMLYQILQNYGQARGGGTAKRTSVGNRFYGGGGGFLRW